jgi:hypothetical protein
MKTNWYRSRVIQYTIYAIMYLIISKLVDFEFAVICALGSIIGEINYKE